MAAFQSAFSSPQARLAALDLGEGPVEVGQARARRRLLDRDPPVAAPKRGEDPVLEAVERREIDMAALRLDDMVMAAAAEQLGDSEPGAGADDADHPVVGQGPLRPAEVAEMRVAELADGMGDGAEIVDQGEALDRRAPAGSEAGRITQSDCW